MRYLLLLPLFCLFLSACQNTDTRPSADDENLYFDYQISADEDQENVTIRLQYKQNGQNGKAVALADETRVLFDGQLVLADSAKFSGVYYETTRPLAEMRGLHSISLVHGNKKARKTSFAFEPFGLQVELPETLRREPLMIRLKNLSSSPTTVRLVMTDTALYSPGINEELHVRDAQFMLTPSLLQNLESGPVTMELFREEIQPVNNGPRLGGKLVLTYSIRRQFELVD